MAKHLVKCLYCGKTFDTNTEEFVKPRANRYAHLSCYQKIEETKTDEERNKENLEKYVKELFNIKSLTPKINKQIKDYHDVKKYSYSGIQKTLKYFFEIKGNSLEKANGGIGIVPFIYEEARSYFTALFLAQQTNEEIVNSEIKVIPVREVHIIPPKREPMRRYRKLFSFLDEEDSSNE